MDDLGNNPDKNNSAFKGQAYFLPPLQLFSNYVHYELEILLFRSAKLGWHPYVFSDVGADSDREVILETLLKVLDIFGLNTISDLSRVIF